MSTEIIVRLKKVVASKTLAAAGDYTANDVLSSNASTGTCWTFSSVARQEGANGYITRAHILFSKDGGITSITPRTTLMLFTAVPTSMLNDNVANTAVLNADKLNYIGRVDFPALSIIGTAGTASPEAVCTPSTSGNLPLAFSCAATSKNIYGILVIIDAEANETASTIVTITLTIEQSL